MFFTIVDGGEGGREMKIMGGEGGGGGNVNKSWRKMDKVLSLHSTWERMLVVVLNVLRDA